ncbi:MAG: M1 family metallopeptidase [Nitritalea sp.]
MKIYTRFTYLLVFLSFAACKSGEKAARPVTDQEVLALAQRDLAAQQTRRERLRDAEDRLQNYRGIQTLEMALLHTQLDLRIDFEQEQVHGDAVLTLRPYFFPQTEVTLDAKDFDLHAVNLLRGDSLLPLPYRYDERRLHLSLPQAYTRTDTLQLHVRYTANPNRNAGGGSRAITDTKGFYFINPRGEDPDKPRQAWTQGETEHNSKWFPTFDSPVQKTTQDFTLRYPMGMRSLSNGRLVEQKSEDGLQVDRWRMEQPHAPYLAAVVIGDFVEIQDEWQGKQVNYYVEPAFAEGAPIVFGRTPEMIQFFSDLLDHPFPWERYDQVVVRDFVSGAMENTTISVFMEALNLTAREAIDSEWDGIIAHELFHQWFGNYVTTASWANLTLNEAFANYSEYLWYAYKEGQDDADLHHIAEMEQYLDEAAGGQKDLIRYHYADPEDMFDSHSYAKGGRILHMLRDYLGDEAFFASLQHYLKAHAYGAVEADQLRLAFREVTGRDLSWFFDQWFFASGHPELRITLDDSDPDNVLLQVEQVQDLGSTPLYRLPLEVSWYREGVRESRQVELQEGFFQVALENGPGVEAIYVDERHVLLAEKSAMLPLAHYETQFRQSHYGVARHAAFDTLMQRGEEGLRLRVMVEALEDPFWGIREKALGALYQEPDLLALAPALSQRVAELAAGDERNTVRAAAIELLGRAQLEAYRLELEDWLDEESYYVAAAALTALLEDETADRSTLAQRYREETNIRMVTAVAGYYIETSAEDQGAWFLAHLSRFSGQNLYYIIGYVGEYFAKGLGTEQEQASAKERLLALAGTHQANYIRLTAFQSLFGFVDDEEVMGALKKIFESEEDPVARQYMAFFLGMFEDA